MIRRSSGPQFQQPKGAPGNLCRHTHFSWQDCVVLSDGTPHLGSLQVLLAILWCLRLWAVGKHGRAKQDGLGARLGCRQGGQMAHTAPET